MKSEELSISREELVAAYRRVRTASEAMCAPLTESDYWLKQPMLDVSPPGWNIGHTSWFFRNLLERFKGEVTDDDRRYDHYLNSYYSVLGDRINRADRGNETWIPVPQLYAYRKSVNERMEKLMMTISENEWKHFAWTVMLGLHHERQHQELFYTEIKYYRFMESGRRPYRTDLTSTFPEKKIQTPLSFTYYSGGLFEFGNIEGGWCFDNELGIHKYYLSDFSLADRLITNSEYLTFINDGAYNREDLWQAEGWQKIQKEKWYAPLYWEKQGNEWFNWTYSGMEKIDPLEPVAHVSFWEAEAFARWLSQNVLEHEQARLPKEYEWEFAARQYGGIPQRANFVDMGLLKPHTYNGVPMSQLFGDVWEWTTSLHQPYPRYEPFSYPFSEYTSKFMYTPLITRGGSCVSERDHIRTSYRNYWTPDTRFQLSGIRLAKN